MKRILLSGGAGFIGSNFVRYVLEGKDSFWHDYQFVVVDSLTYAGDISRLPLTSAGDRLEFNMIDIRDRTALANLGSQIDGIINFAAETHVDNSISDPISFVDTNVIGACNLFEIARKKRVRILQVSTDEVYGSLSSGKATEDYPLNPSSPYSASKAGADLLGLSYFKTFGLDLIITRCTNNYGPSQFPEKLIPHFISALKSGKQVPLYGEGKNFREWISVEDHCNGISLAYQKGLAGEIYNFGSGEEYSNIQITRLLLEVLGLDDSRISYVKDRLGHDFRYAVDSSKASRELGWAAKDQLTNRIEELINCY